MSASWVVVSGAGGSLGSAVALHLAGQGRPVLALDQAFPDPAIEGIVRLELDLTGDQHVARAITDSIPRGERIGLLVNAVGKIWNEPVLAFRGARLVSHALATWRQTIDANLTAPFIAANAVIPLMARSGGGAIVNFSSIAARGNAGQAAYAAAKAGLEGLTRTLAIELGPLAIRVNAVALGFIDVPSTREHVQGDRLLEHARATPLRRLGRLDDVLQALDYLEQATYVTGSVIPVDGALRL
jgi:3-oxoacyl-[acyl-carrier protein] reductase